MSETSTNGMSLLDPFGFWKTARDTNLEAWSKVMIDFVNSDEYARTTGVALEQLLATSQPFRDALEKAMTQTLTMLNMPSRAEVITLAERLVNVEMRLDDLDAKLSNVHKSLRDTIKEALVARPAPVTAHRDLEGVEAHLEQVNARLDTLLKAVGQLRKAEPERPAKPAQPVRDTKPAQHATPPAEKKA